MKGFFADGSVFFDQEFYAMDRPLRLFRRILCAFTALIAFGIASPAIAGPDLIDELPDGHDTLIAIDFTELRGSPLFDQTFEALSSQPDVATLLGQLHDDLGLDPRNDLDALVMTSDSPPLSADLLQQPAGALQNAAARDGAGGLVIIRGDIEMDALMERLRGESGDESDGEYVRSDGMELRSLDDRTVAIAFGDAEFLDTARGKLSADRSGPGAVFERAIERLGRSQGIYLMISPTVADPEAVEDEMGAIASFAAVSVNLGADQVRIGALMQLDDDETAAALLEEVDGLRREAAGNPLASLLGFRPILENLSLQQEGDEIVIRSSMSNQQAIRLAGQAARLASRGQQLQNPLEGRGIETDDSDSDDEADDGDDAEEIPDPSPDGVEADFN